MTTTTDDYLTALNDMPPTTADHRAALFADQVGAQALDRIHAVTGLRGLTPAVKIDIEAAIYAAIMEANAC